MKYVVRVVVLLMIWAAVSVLILAIFSVVPGVEPIQAGEAAESEEVWDGWLALSAGLLITIAIAMGAWVYQRRRTLRPHTAQARARQ